MTDVKTDEMPGEQQPEVVQKEVVAAAPEQAGEPTTQHAVENGNEAKTEETVVKPEDGTVNNDNSNNNNNTDNNNDGNADENTNGKESAALPNDGEVEDQDYAENEVYKKLRLQSVKPKVAVALIQLYESTEMSPDDMDERAIDMLRSFPVDHAIFVIGEVSKSNLLGVQNHAQFMMSVMRNFRDKVRQMGAAQALSESLVQGPSYESVKAILDRTGYQLEVTNGQRKYGGPPPDWDGPATGPTGAGHEIYIGKIPNEIYEDALIPLFEECGKMWDLRLMMDPLTGKNRGYAFVTYCDKNSAAEAAKKYDGHEILPGKCLKVNVSIANTRLFIGNIPKSKSKEEILAEFKEHAEGVTDVIIYSSPDAGENRKNRGFCFLDFCDHKSASDAKRKIHAGKLRAWNLDLVVDWAEQQEEPDEETMAKVKVLYVRNLKEAVSEAQLKEMFATHGEVDHVKKIKDYAFVHFVEREPAIKAMEALNGTVLEGIPIEISLAKPQSEKKKVVRGRGRGFGSAARSTGMGGGQFSDYGGGYGGRTGAQAGGMMRGGGRVPPSAGYGGVRSGAGYGTAPVDYGYGAYDPYAGYDETYGYGAPGAGYGGYGTAYDSYGYGSGADAYSYGYGNASQMRGGSGGRGGGRGGGFNTSSFMPRGSAGRGRSVSRSGGGSGRGAKRAADGMGGPATKREFGGDMM